jgi:hypothetical protein
LANESNIFTLRFFGNDVSPESFTLKELANLFAGFEDAINSIIDNNNQDYSECRVSLIGVEHKSNSLSLCANNEKTSIAINKYAEFVKTNKYTSLPEDAYNFHKKLVSTSQDKGCSVALVSKGADIFVVTVQDEFIKQESVSIKTETVIYGHLLGLSTSNSESQKARAKVELFTGEKITFEVSESDRRKLTPYLWNVVGLLGCATYNTLTKNYIKFKFTNVTNYKSGGILEGLDNLKNITSGFWDTLNTDDEIRNYLKG